jgi:hypothetical protein
MVKRRAQAKIPYMAAEQGGRECLLEPRLHCAVQITLQPARPPTRILQAHAFARSVLPHSSSSPHPIEQSRYHRLHGIIIIASTLRLDYENAASAVACACQNRGASSQRLDASVSAGTRRSGCADESAKGVTGMERVDQSLEDGTERKRLTVLDDGTLEHWFIEAVDCLCSLSFGCDAC